MKTKQKDDLPLFEVVDLSFIFRDVTAKPFNCDKSAIRQLNRLIDTQDHLEVELPIALLYATQPRVNKDYQEAAQRHCPKNPYSLPAVVKYLGFYYVTDGHHRLVAWHYSGHVCAKVRLFDLDGDTQTDMPLLDFLEG